MSYCQFRWSRSSAPGATCYIASTAITVTYVETTKGHIKEEKVTQKHLCPGCATVIKTEGQGKLAKDVVKHVCQTCGSEDAFCCVLKKGSGPTKGMEKEKK